jgi:hypothetical protein
MDFQVVMLFRVIVKIFPFTSETMQMPNWCLNTVIVTNPNPAKIQALKDSLNKDVFFDHILPLGEWDYDKAIKTWSTKWEASNLSWMQFESTKNQVEISFESAWCPPEEVYNAMVADGWTVEAYFFEPGMGFVGKYGTDLDGIYEESYEINNEPIPAELVEMFGIQEMFEDTEYELVENDDGFYEVKEIENVD